MAIYLLLILIMAEYKNLMQMVSILQKSIIQKQVFGDPEMFL